MKKYKKIYIEITNNCNLNCSFCSKNNRKKKNMTKEEYEEVLKKIKDYTNYIYLHVTGEPLIHPNIIEFINLADKYNLKVNLTTNGTLLKKYVKDLDNCKNLNKINISLHCEHNNNSYFNDVFKSCDILSRNRTIIYRLWTLNNNLLDEKSTKIVDKIKNHYKLSTKTVDKIKYEKNIKILPTIYVDKDNEFIWPSLEGIETNGYCYALKTHLAILSDGSIVPCCLDAEGIINLGNIFKESLEDIENKEKFNKLKKSFQDRKPCEMLCKRCSYKNRKID